MKEVMPQTAHPAQVITDGNEGWPQSNHGASVFPVKTPLCQSSQSGSFLHLSRLHPVQASPIGLHQSLPPLLQMCISVCNMHRMHMHLQRLLNLDELECEDPCTWTSSDVKLQEQLCMQTNNAITQTCKEASSGTCHFGAFTISQMIATSRFTCFQQHFNSPLHRAKVCHAACKTLSVRQHVSVPL